MTTTPDALTAFVADAEKVQAFVASAKEAHDLLRGSSHPPNDYYCNICVLIAVATDRERRLGEVLAWLADDPTHKTHCAFAWSDMRSDGLKSECTCGLSTILSGGGDGK
jgi:hypothetical protein